MDLTRISIIKKLLKKYNAKPEKYLGQHFLLSKRALRKTIEAAEIKPKNLIIEIGPGLGTLTQELAKTGAKIIAIEKDPLMNQVLKETLADCKNVKIIQADVRNLWVYETYKDGYKIVANLPYNIATFLIRSFLESDNPPKMMVLMIQKEVAQRICSKPPHMNLLAVSTQFLAIAEIIDYVPKNDFWPKPKVDAAIIKITPKERTSAKTLKAFFAVVKAGFSQPRKLLLSNLAKKLNFPKERLILIFKDLDISEKTRAENLDIDHWMKLASRVIHN